MVCFGRPGLCIAAGLEARNIRGVATAMDHGPAAVCRVPPPRQRSAVLVQYAAISIARACMRAGTADATRVG